jgi:hypothetical protein
LREILLKIAQGGEVLGEGLGEPGLERGGVGRLVALEVVAGFFVALAGGVKLGPGDALERALVDEDERARAGTREAWGGSRVA